VVLPSKGGLLSSFTDVFRIEVDSAIFPTSKCTVIDAHHFPDDKILTLDLYAWHRPATYPDPAENADATHDFYVNNLRNSKTSQDGCRA